MDPVTGIPVPRVIDIEGFGDLFETLVAEGYRVIGPAVQDDAIVLTELSSPAELPFGWGVTLASGGCRLRRRDDAAVFGHAAGPQSWKRFLHPPREQPWSATIRRSASDRVDHLHRPHHDAAERVAAGRPGPEDRERQ